MAAKRSGDALGRLFLCEMDCGLLLVIVPVNAELRRVRGGEGRVLEFLSSSNV